MISVWKITPPRLISMVLFLLFLSSSLDICYFFNFSAWDVCKLWFNDKVNLAIAPTIMKSRWSVLNFSLRLRPQYWTDLIETIKCIWTLYFHNNYCQNSTRGKGFIWLVLCCDNKSYVYAYSPAPACTCFFIVFLKLKVTVISNSLSSNTFVD